MLAGQGGRRKLRLIPRPLDHAVEGLVRSERTMKADTTKPMANRHDRIAHSAVAYDRQQI